MYGPVKTWRHGTESVRRKRSHYKNFKKEYSDRLKIGQNFWIYTVEEEGSERVLESNVSYGEDIGQNHVIY